MSLATRAFNIHLSCNTRCLNKVGLRFIQDLQTLSSDAQYQFTDQRHAQVVITVQPMSDNNQLSISIQNPSAKRLFHVQLDLHTNAFRTKGLSETTKRKVGAQSGTVNKLIFLAALINDALLSK